MSIDYLVALGEARSCLAALADSTDDVDLSVYYDRLLIELDFITGDVGPAYHPMIGTRDELLRRFDDAVDRLVDHGGDGLRLELLLRASASPFGYQPLVQDSGADDVSDALGDFVDRTE